MKVKNEVLKQARICSLNTVESLSARLNLSVGYIRKLEAGEINNLEYIYPKYARALRIKEGCLKKVMLDAEREGWDSEKIRAEVEKIFV